MGRYLRFLQQQSERVSGVLVWTCELHWEELRDDGDADGALHDGEGV